MCIRDRATGNPADVAALDGRTSVFGVLAGERGEIGSALDLFQQVVHALAEGRKFLVRFAGSLDQNVEHVHPLGDAEAIALLVIGTPQIAFRHFGGGGDFGLINNEIEQVACCLLYTSRCV